MNLASNESGERPSDAVHDNRIRHDSVRGVLQAGLLFSVVGVIGLVSDALPGFAGHGHLTSVILDAVLLPVGIAAVLLRKKRFLQGRPGLLLAVFAMAIIAANNVNGSLATATFGTYFMLIVVWVGIWYPPWTVAALSPVMAAAYMAPLFLGAPRSPGDVPAVFLVVPITVLAGETIAHYTDRVRRAVASRERLLSDMSRENVTDALTGVGNRRLGGMLLESPAPGDAVAILDVDHFKEVNDNYGHPEGDRLLHELGSCLNAFTRDRDANARMGGDEFLVVMRGAGPEGIDIASRLLRSWRQGSPLATISAGVAVHRSRTSPEATYAEADRALYEAKHTGCDRAVLANVADRAA